MKNALYLAPLLAIAVPAMPAFAAPAQQAEKIQDEAKIAFPNQGGIRDWKSEGDRIVYIQDRARNWYKATLIAPVPDLSFVNRIGFRTKGTDTFDRFSSIVIEGQPYALKSLVKIDDLPVGGPEEDI